MARKRFWYHYNKPASKKAGRPVLSVHYEDRCQQVHMVKCKVDTETQARKRQPFCVVRGWCEGIIFFRSVGKNKTEDRAVIY